MSWHAKPDSPEYFSLADAFLALITGDAQWGWLVDWLTLVPNLGFNTESFCQEGPIFTEPLVVTDFIPTSNPLDPRQILHTAALGYRLQAAARDRVFAAYCEMPGVLTAGWSESICTYFDDSGALRTDGIFVGHAPAGATQMRVASWVEHGANYGGNIAILCEGPYTSFTPEPFHGDVGGLETMHTTHPPLTVNGDVDVYLTIRQGGAGELCVQFNSALGGTPYGPTEQPQPEGVTSPLGATPATLEGIARELDRQEFKLDTLWALAQSVAGATLDLGGPLGEEEELEKDVPKPVGDAVGCIVTLSPWPAGLSISFGNPQEAHRLGWINIGTVDAWYPVIPLTHTPTVIRPFPPATTRVVTSGLPPGVTATIQMILPLK